MGNSFVKSPLLREINTSLLEAKKSKLFALQQNRHGKTSPLEWLMSSLEEEN